METNNDYHFSLFSPNSAYSRRVRNIVITILIIWVLAVFGFQILLRVLEKPTPEKSFTQFESVWEQVKSGNAGIEDKATFINSLSHVLGKSSLKKEHKVHLVNALNWGLYSISDSSDKIALANAVASYTGFRQEAAESKKDADILQLKEKGEKAKTEILAIIEKTSQIKGNSLEAGVIAFNLTSEAVPFLNEDDILALPQLMNTYLVHNQSVLTDSKFIGFPFHYFYSSIFLLVLFVFLCLVFSMRVDKLQKKFNIVE